MSEDDRDKIHQQFLQWRNVDDPCEVCRGSGVRSYGSTSTWRGGMGGARITIDVCDRCWGTGDKYRRGADLRAWRNEEQKRIAEAAVDALVRSCGAQMNTTRASVAEIADHIRKLHTGRKATLWTGELAKGLADLLDRAIGRPT